MKKLLPILALLFVLSACTDDFLNVEHRSKVLDNEYYSSEERMFTALVATYDPLQWFDYFYQYNALNLVSDIMGDDILCGGSNDADQPILVKTHRYALTSTDVPNQIWTVAYSGINRANIVLERIGNVEMDETLRNQWIAEATVLKVYYYSVVWKLWGNIPYYDMNVTQETEYMAKQIPADEVYANIIAKLQEAIDLNVLPMKAAAGNEGRVTEAMAKMLFAEIVMYQKDTEKYPTALQYMRDIISSNQYSLVSDYAGIWLESGEFNSESIWEINYISENAGRDWSAPIACGGTVYSVLIGIPGYQGSTFVDGWGFSPVARSAYEMFEDNDQRRDGSILNFEEWAAETGDSYAPRWQDTGLFLLKYIARKDGNHGYAADPNMNYGNNRRMYRYAETLLNAAELAELTGADGSEYLNQVRTRAGVGTIDSNVDNILEERHLEFVGEGKRYWDLVRSGKAATVLTASEWRAAGWSENKKYFPIPQSELDRVSGEYAMEQNPY